jgi:molybdopterin/thiamine biosynthesis adenylyltransferase
MYTEIWSTENLWNSIKKSLFPPNDSREHFGFGLAGINNHSDSCKILLRKFIPADNSCLIKQAGAYVEPHINFVHYLWNLAKESNSVLIDVHSHPFSNNIVNFSGIDDRSEYEGFPKAVEYLGEGPHASIVLGRSSVAARWYNSGRRCLEPIKAIKIIGNTLEIIKPTNNKENTLENLDYREILSKIHDRQILVFGKQGQKALQRIRIGIVGVGGIGSEVFIKLVRLGVVDIVIIDPDIVERSNLNRLAGSTIEDAQKSRPKVKVLAEFARKINPNVRVKAICGSVLDEDGEKELKSCDVFFGCTDNQSTRVALNNFSIRYLIPYIDTGTGIESDLNQKIKHAGGQVRVIIPGKGCLNCIDGIDLDIAQQEQLPEPERQISIRHGYIDGEDVHAPAVASLNGPIANFAVTEFITYVTGFKSLHKYVFYDFLNSRTTGFDFQKDPRCFVCNETGIFAAGDKGTNIPVNMLLEEHKPVKGEIKMKDNNINRTQLLDELLSAALTTSVHIESDPRGKWFLLKSIRIGSAFNKPKSDVMVKFEDKSNDPIILVPDNINIRTNGDVCKYLLDENTFIKGWRKICPHIICDVGDELYLFINCLSGLLANPSYCGFMGCEGKTARERNNHRKT